MSDDLKNYVLLMTSRLAEKTHIRAKTVTRRVLRRQPSAGATLAFWDGCAAIFSDGTEVAFPYGGVGAEVYIKETFYAFGKWSKDGKTKTGKQKYIFNDLTGKFPHALGTDKYLYDVNSERPAYLGNLKDREKGSLCWWKRPSLFMPKRAARSIVVINHVKVEPVQMITGAEALLEGVELSQTEHDGAAGFKALSAVYKRKFKELWETIHGQGAWAKNEWVWAISFDMKK